MFSANTAISRKVLVFGKVRATIPKGIMGGFEFTVLQRNLRELKCTRGHGRKFAIAKGKQPV